MKKILYIIMYHYVRPLEKTRYPHIKGLRLEEFDAQLSYLCANFHPVTVSDVLNSVYNKETLPQNAFLLTFDDGYLDHFLYVFPRLQRLHIQGVFFPPVLSALHGELLDVNRIHFILAAMQNPEKIKDAIDNYIREYRTEFQLCSPEDYWKQWGKPGRFDSAVIVYAKMMLQLVLPVEIRSRITKLLFSRYVSVDEIAFTRELYMDTIQLATMQRCGMAIGSHGNSHVWLDSLEPEQQVAEIDIGLSFLRAIGCPVDDYWLMCYPYGGWNCSLLNILHAKNCRLGFTTEVAIANLEKNNPLLLPRLDTNDFLKSQ